MIGSHTAQTRGSAAAFAAISGPTPAGSPDVIAMRGLMSLRIGDCGFDRGLWIVDWLRLRIADCGSAVTAAGTAAARAAPAGAAAAGIVAAAFAAAAAVLHAFRVRQLVAQAALQPAAQPRQLRRVQAQVLLLGHLDRDRLERLQERRAAERPAAGAVAAVHLRFVAHADLPHLDPRAEFGGELAHQFPEIDAAVGGEIENQLRPVERLLDARQLHAEAALADFQQRDPERLLFA